MQQHTADRTKEKDGAERERGGLWPTHCVCLLRKQQATERVTDSHETKHEFNDLLCQMYKDRVEAARARREKDTVSLVARRS